jgi:hypothetical protein
MVRNVNKNDFCGMQFLVALAFCEYSAEHAALLKGVMTTQSNFDCEIEFVKIFCSVLIREVSIKAGFAAYI